MRNILRFAGAVAVFVAAAPGQRVFHTVEAALELAFQGATVERTTQALSEADRAAIEVDAGTAEARAVVFPYVARKDGKVVGTAYFDTHRVRTLRESVMVVVRPDGRVERVLLCAFGEPVEYVPRERWYAQFEGRQLDDQLRLRRGIDGVTGATLTARATTECVRRALALHRVLARRQPAPAPDPKPAPEGGGTAWIDPEDRG